MLSDHKGHQGVINRASILMGDSPLYEGTGLCSSSAVLFVFIYFTPHADLDSSVHASRQVQQVYLLSFTIALLQSSNTSSGRCGLFY